MKVITIVNKSLDHSGIRVSLPKRHPGLGEHSDTNLCHTAQAALPGPHSAPVKSAGNKPQTTS